MRAWYRYFDSAFGRYAVTSALATTTDFALAGSLHTAGLGAAVATFCGCVAGGLVAFWLSRGWTFRAGATSAWPQILRFLLVWATSAALNSGGVPVLLGWLGSFPLSWVLMRACVYLGWNYPLSRWFVFSTAKPPAELSAP